MRLNRGTFVAGWAVLMLAGAGSLAPPLLARARLVSDTALLKAELSKPVDGPEVVEQLSNDLRTLREFGEGRMTPIPAQSDVAGLMSMLSETLTACGLQKRDITVRPTKVYGDPAEAWSLPVTILLQGRFTDVRRALEQVESMPRLVRVDRLRAVADEQQAGMPSRAGLVRADLAIEAFYIDTSGEAAGRQAQPHAAGKATEGGAK